MVVRQAMHQPMEVAAPLQMVGEREGFLQVVQRQVELRGEVGRLHLAQTADEVVGLEAAVASSFPVPGREEVEERLLEVVSSQGESPWGVEAEHRVVPAWMDPGMRSARQGHPPCRRSPGWGCPCLAWR